MAKTATDCSDCYNKVAEQTTRTLKRRRQPEILPRRPKAPVANATKQPSSFITKSRRDWPRTQLVRLRRSVQPILLF